MKFFALNSLVFTSLLMACGPDGAGPSVPSLTATTGGGEAVGENGEGTDPSNATAPFDATVAHRLLALPKLLQDQITTCEASGAFYDLGGQTCTTIQRSAVHCVINDEFRALLDATTLMPLETYLSTKVASHRLYACTEAGANFTLHFYQFADNTVNYKKLNIAKKAQ